MPIQILIEGAGAEVAAKQITDEIPSAEIVSPEENTRGLLTIATVVAIFGAIGAGAKAVKDLADAGKSIAELAKFLLEWKRESAPKEKTIILVQHPDQPKETFILREETEEAALVEFLEQQS